MQDLNNNNVEVEVAIRPAAPADYAAVLTMVQAMATHCDSSYRPGWQDSGEGQSLITFHLDKGWGVVAEHGGEPVGHLGWRLERTRPPKLATQYSEVICLYVKPEYRHQQVAQKMGAAYLAWCEKSGISDIRFSVSPNHPSMAVFKTLGFVDARRVMVHQAKDG